MTDGASKNEPGFADRLAALMDGWGYSTRDLAKASGVSHATISNWLSDEVRAGLEQVAAVARVFGWTADELYYGRPGEGIMGRYARLDAFRAAVRRIVKEYDPGSDNLRGIVAHASLSGVPEPKSGEEGNQKAR